ncbi:hypothetical protein CH294_01810 [Rhodococcus sp. 14-2483-1-1]|nr:hypothetical protein CH294_01810 [Rhodococcus sp. 14-2483-1-1]
MDDTLPFMESLVPALQVLPLSAEPSSRGVQQWTDSTDDSAFTLHRIDGSRILERWLWIPAEET